MSFKDDFLSTEIEKLLYSETNEKYNSNLKNFLNTKFNINYKEGNSSILVGNEIYEKTKNTNNDNKKLGLDNLKKIVENKKTQFPQIFKKSPEKLNHLINSSFGFKNGLLATNNSITSNQYLCDGYLNQDSTLLPIIDKKKAKKDIFDDEEKLVPFKLYREEKETFNYNHVINKDILENSKKYLNEVENSFGSEKLKEIYNYSKINESEKNERLKKETQSTFYLTTEVINNLNDKESEKEDKKLKNYYDCIIAQKKARIFREFEGKGENKKNILETEKTDNERMNSGKV